jgi:hypothetical protein
MAVAAAHLVAAFDGAMEKGGVAAARCEAVRVKPELRD